MSRQTFISVIFIFVVLKILTGCSEKKESEEITLKDDLLKMHRPLTTNSAQAQQYFNQGLALYFGFNHEASIQSFARITEFDPQNGMSWWGQALAAGPNINNPYMDSSATVFAYESIQKAVANSVNLSAVEQDLINALAQRYTLPMPEDRSHLDSAYAQAMKEVWQKYPQDNDVGALYAEALMDLRPWDLWNPDGTANPGTDEIVVILENILARDPEHPGACHFYIHTMEASPTPEKATKAADVLRDRIPGAGHLVHMPAHIDIRLGKYADAILANQKAIDADSVWASSGGFYAIYTAHNYHFMVYAAMFDGQKNLAIQGARDMVKQIPVDLIKEYPEFLDGFMAVPVHVMVRFGMWRDMLLEPEPESYLPVTKAFWHYGRTIAYAATGLVFEAQKELLLLKQACKEIPEEYTIGNNSAKTVLQVGIPMAEGEVAYRGGDYDKAYKFLETAVLRDDELRYDEPWGWMMPVRHSLGALLLEQGNLQKAEQVYREDLKIHPGNGWALQGLSTCLQIQDKTEEAAVIQDQFAKAWQRSDTQIKTSCFCATQG